MKFYYVYVLESVRFGNWYTGYSSDLKKRLSEHQAGQTTSTKYKGPWKLIYYEASLTMEDAVAREKYLKSGMGKRYIRNRVKNYLNKPDDF